MADLAAQQGLSPRTFRNKGLHRAEGHPDPISSDSARTLLWDSEQTSAFYAGDPVPALTEADDDEDLLDRHEAAAVLGVTASSWNVYKNTPALAEHAVPVEGVDHWPRRVVRAYKAARPGSGAGGGRRTGSGDMVPRDQILPRIAELLDENPAITLTEVADTLGIAKFPTAQAGLAQVRGRRMADLIEADPGLSPQQAAEQLGYPPITHRGASVIAEAELHARRSHPYLQQIADALADAGVAVPTQVEVRHPKSGHLTAAIKLVAAQTVPALVWDERYGWRTATNRLHPIGKDTGAPPEGAGIRYIGSGIRPEPAELLEALDDESKGSGHPAA
ncbi:DUF6292 family protein [Streptomyces sp. NPDC053720]|uniref:DUF6292 family protein n=1 Tax=Streptomyces sp. NPDC053720 TaxID=3154855 RepID=UPI003432A483